MRALVIAIVLALLSATVAQAGSRCVAHRGNNVHHLENSFASLRSAHEIGSHGIEFDVRHTSDGVAVLLHDAALDRVSSNCTGDVNQKTLRQVQACSLQNGEPIPLLSEVLTEAQTWQSTLFVELKDVPSLATVALLTAHHKTVAKRVRVISFNKQALQALQQVSSLLLYKLAIKLNAPRIRRRLATEWSGYDLMLVGKRRIQRITDLGGEVAVWTIDDPNKMARLSRRGVHWITTNDPQACLAL